MLSAGTVITGSWITLQSIAEVPTVKIVIAQVIMASPGEKEEKSSELYAQAENLRNVQGSYWLWEGEAQSLFMPPAPSNATQALSCMF